MTSAFVLRALWRHLGLAASLVVLGLGAAVAQPYVLPQTWTASGQVLLGVDPAAKSAPADATEYLINRMPTYAAFAQSPAVLAAAATATGRSVSEVVQATHVNVVASTVVLEIDSSASDPTAAVALNRAVIASYVTAAPLLDQRAGGPALVIQQIQPPTAAPGPDGLHGPVLYLVAAVAAATLALGVSVSIELVRGRPRPAGRPQPATTSPSATPTKPGASVHWPDPQDLTRRKVLQP